MKRHFLLFTFPFIAAAAAVGTAQTSSRAIGTGHLQTERPALTRELSAEVNASRQDPDLVAQRRVAALPGVRISVRTDGMYRVTRAELEAAGFPVESDAANWRLFRDGNEQAVIVGDGGEFVDFYGRGIDTFETDTSIYYLVSDTVPGLRMEPRFMRSIGGSVVSRNFTSIVKKSDRINYFPSFLNGDADNYYGQGVVNDPVAYTNITLSGIDQQGPDAALSVELLGYAGVDHTVRVMINGHDAGYARGSGRSLFRATFTVPAAWLQPGVNTIRFTAQSPSDVSLTGTATISFSRLYSADQDKIAFTTTSYRRVKLTDFGSPDIRVFDITRDGAPRLVANPVIGPEGHTYSVSLPSDRPAIYYAVDDSALMHSPSITFNTPSTLASTDNAADMIIISHSSPEFMAAAESWAEYRRSAAGGALNVRVVDVEDIFDEFSYGLHTAAALKGFIAYARQNWQTPAPAYVMLVGDASYDRRNYEGFGYWDLVPTFNRSFEFEEAGSDDPLADVDDDGVPDLAIGRIPARTAQAVMTALAKTVDLETPANQTLYRGAVFAYDRPTGYDFGAESHLYRNQLPRYIPTQFISRDSPTAHNDLIDAIDAGPFVVNFSGHSTAGLWGQQDFFKMDDVATLTNTHSPAIFVMLTNYTGLFTRSRYDCMSEALLFAPNGGAAATFAGVTITPLNARGDLGNAFFRELGQGDIRTIGGIINEAKRTVAGTDTGYAFNLIGDPAMKVR